MVPFFYHFVSFYICSVSFQHVLIHFLTTLFHFPIVSFHFHLYCSIFKTFWLISQLFRYIFLSVSYSIPIRIPIVSFLSLCFPVTRNTIGITALSHPYHRQIITTKQQTFNSVTDYNKKVYAQHLITQQSLNKLVSLRRKTVTMPLTLKAKNIQ